MFIISLVYLQSYSRVHLESIYFAETKIFFAESTVDKGKS